MKDLHYLEPMVEGHCAFWAHLVAGSAMADPRVGRVTVHAGADLAERLHPDLCDGADIRIVSKARLSALRDGGLARRGWAQWRMARSLAAERSGCVVLPFFDHALIGAALDRRPVAGTIGGIVFRPPSDYGLVSTRTRRAMARRKWLTYRLAARRGTCLMTLDEYSAAQAPARTGKPLHFVPDPAPPATLLEGRSPAVRTDGRHVALLFGALGQRKGVHALLDAVPHLPGDIRARLVLRLAGRILPEERASVMAHLERTRADIPDLPIELEDRFLSEDEIACEVVSAHVVLAPYQGHVGSSGILLWAAQAQRPVLTQRTGLMGCWAVEHRLGCTVDTHDPAAIAQALSAVIRDPQANSGFSAPHARAFAARHAAQRFGQQIVAHLLAQGCA